MRTSVCRFCFVGTCVYTRVLDVIRVYAYAIAHVCMRCEYVCLCIIVRTQSGVSGAFGLMAVSNWHSINAHARTHTPKIVW